MDSSQQALQANEKLFFQISESLFESTSIFFLIIVALGLYKQGGGGICADQHAFYLSVLKHILLYQLWLTHGRHCFNEKVDRKNIETLYS